MLAGALVGVVAEQVGGGLDAAALLGDQRGPVADPRVGDELAGLALELAEHGVHGHRDARHHRRHVRVDQLGQLITVTAAERADLDR